MLASTPAFERPVAPMNRFVVTMICLGLLVGCGGDGAPAPTSSPPTTPAPAPPAPAPPQPEPPGVPTGLRVSASGENFIEWRWTAVTGAGGYDVQFSRDAVFTTEDEIVARAAEELSYRREGLAAGTSAYVRVRSALGSGEDRITSDWSPHVTGMTAPEPPPPEPAPEPAAPAPGADGKRILLELAPEDTVPPRPFDLNRRTVEFTPGGSGGYSRSVRQLAWESDIGPAVADGSAVAFGDFQFPFAGRDWDTFHISSAGVITFDGALTYEGSESNLSMREHAEIDLVKYPTIAPLYKPYLGFASKHGVTDDRVAQHVAVFPDRVVVTWVTSEPERWPHGASTKRLARFQVVLTVDGNVRFNYADAPFGDGAVGLFPNEKIEKDAIIGHLVDETDPELPGHVDILDVTIYASNAPGVIVEWRTRSSIPAPEEGTSYSYRLYFDTDLPFWTQYDRSDRDFYWEVEIEPGGQRHARGGHVLPGDSPDRVAMWADTRDLSGIAAAVTAGAWHFADDTKGDRASRPVRIELPDALRVDLSRSDARFSNQQSEVFHYRSTPNTETIACRIVEHFGDVFDFMVFHSEFAYDVQRHGSSWYGYYGNTGVVEGTGYVGDRKAPCGEGRLKGHIYRPWWIWDRRVFEVTPGRYHPDNIGFDRGLYSFSHELAHTWVDNAFYMRNGKKESLSVEHHWRDDLHLPAAFPWRTDAGRHQSLMGLLTWWGENSDGTFARRSVSKSALGFSWLDLYAMGLAQASEVPDMFIVRNAMYIGRGRYRGDKEVVSIEQIIEADGPREPTFANAQKDFNVAFLYLLEPGQTPSPEPLEWHTRFLDQAVAHWFHVTGGRSRLTTDIPSVTSR